MQLIPLELVKSNRDGVRKAREVYLIERGQTLEPLGLTRPLHTKGRGGGGFILYENGTVYKDACHTHSL